MSKYTTELRFICETLARYDESQGFGEVGTIISESREMIFDFDYPIFDQNYKVTLETKILRHFYTREIGEETYGLWKLRLEDKLNLIMPYYNQLYESELIKFNPMYDVDLKTTGQNIGTAQENGTENINNKFKGEQSQLNTRKTENENSRIGETSFKTKDKRDFDTSAVNIYDRQNNSIGNETNTQNRTEENTGYSQGKSAEHYEGKENDKNYNLFSDTPQSGLEGVDGESEVISPDVPSQIDYKFYLTDARKITDDKNVSHDKQNTDNVVNGATAKGTTSNVNDTTETNRETNTANENYSSRENTENEHNTNDTSIVNGVEKREDSGNLQNNTESDEKRENTKNANNTEDYFKHVIGKNGGVSYSKLLMEFRETFLNIDLMIIRELEPLFMGLW